MTESSPVEARNWPPRAVAAVVMLGLGALGYLLFPCPRACGNGVLW